MGLRVSVWGCQSEGMSPSIWGHQSDGVSLSVSGHQSKGISPSVQWHLGPKIFLDEGKMELNPYLNSTKDRYCCDFCKHHLQHSCCCSSSVSSRQWQVMLEMLASMAGSDGLMVLGVFISDGRSWCHIFSQRETVKAHQFIAAMRPFFTWLRAAGIEENRYWQTDPS